MTEDKDKRKLILEDHYASEDGWDYCVYANHPDAWLYVPWEDEPELHNIPFEVEVKVYLPAWYSEKLEEHQAEVDKVVAEYEAVELPQELKEESDQAEESGDAALMHAIERKIDSYWDEQEKEHRWFERVDEIVKKFEEEINQ